MSGLCKPGMGEPTMAKLVGTFAAALFDMDGTLIDSARNGERAWGLLAEQWQLTAPDSALFRSVHGMAARQALSRIVPTALVKAACRDLERIESEDTEGVKALPGAIELFSAVPEQRRTIVTSSFPDVAMARLLAAGIVPPALMITCEQITRGKPDPEPFLAGAALMCVPPDQAIAFEDTRPGIRSAKAAGCTVIAVEGLHRRSELAEADYVVAALTDVRVFNAGDDGFSVEVA